jgi:hypothetical protein
MHGKIVLLDEPVRRSSSERRRIVCPASSVAILTTRAIVIVYTQNLLTHPTKLMYVLIYPTKLRMMVEKMSKSRDA